MLMMRHLTAAGFQADHAQLGADGLAMVSTVDYAAVILDLSLPDLDGLDVLRQMRSQKIMVPVLILTARDAVMDRVQGLHAGGDDYLVKPFATEELMARLHALLRRQGQVWGDSLSLGNVRMDTQSREVEINGRPQVLSLQELTLLELFLRRLGKVATKKHLEDQLFGHSVEVSPNALEVAIHRLRKRLEQAEANLTLHTVRGVGYMLSEAA